MSDELEKVENCLKFWNVADSLIDKVLKDIKGMINRY